MSCDCCNNEPDIGVASSSLGAFSIAWGRKCLEAGVEPWWAVVYTTSVCVPPGERTLDPHCAEWFQELVKRSLEYFGKTMDDLWNDVQKQHEDEAANN